MSFYDKTLPIELQMAVINSVDDLSTLKSCSLVARSWRNDAQRKVLNSMVIDGDQRKGSVPLSPTSASYVSRVTLKTFEIGYTDSVTEWGARAEFVMEQLTVLGHSRVTHLTFKDFSFYRWPPEAEVILRNAFQHVTHLSLELVSLVDSAHIFTFLLLCPKLRFLYLSEVDASTVFLNCREWLKSHPNEAQQMAALFTKIEELHLIRVCYKADHHILMSIADLLEFVPSKDLHPNFRIKFACDSNDLDLLECITLPAGEGLKRLHIQRITTCPAPAPPPGYLRTCTKLRELKITDHPAYAEDWIEGILGELPPAARIHKLEIKCMPYSNEETTDDEIFEHLPPPKSFDALKTGEQFSELSEFVFTVYEREGMSPQDKEKVTLAVSTWLASELGHLYKKGRRVSVRLRAPTRSSKYVELDYNTDSEPSTDVEMVTDTEE